MTPARDRIRVQLDFDQQGFNELEALKTDLRAGSRADTVRLGLGLLRWAANQLKSGARILIEKDGELRGVVFPFLPEPQVKASSTPVTLQGKFSVGGSEQPLSPEELFKKQRDYIQETLDRAGKVRFKPAPRGKSASPGAGAPRYEEEHG